MMLSSSLDTPGLADYFASTRSFWSYLCFFYFFVFFSCLPSFVFGRVLSQSHKDDLPAPDVIFFSMLMMALPPSFRFYTRLIAVAMFVLFPPCSSIVVVLVLVVTFCFPFCLSHRLFCNRCPTIRCRYLCHRHHHNRIILLLLLSS